MTPYYYDRIGVICAVLTMNHKIPGNIALLAAKQSTSTSSTLQWVAAHYPELLL